MPNKCPVKAVFAALMPMPCKLINPLAVKAPRPPLAMPYATKKARNSNTGAVSRRLRPRFSVSMPVDCFGVSALSPTKLPLRKSIKAHSAIPARPVAIKAVRQSAKFAIASIVSGAHAPPRKPANVWIEKARPSRSSLIEPERME